MENQEIKVVIHVAVSDDGFIGKDGKLPWMVPSDLRWFRAHTIGRPVIMGRKTFESMGRPLDRRFNIVLTSQFDKMTYDYYEANRKDGGRVHFVTTALFATRLAFENAKAMNSDEVVVIGGAAIYTEFLPMVDRICMTQIHTTVNGDTKFPSLIPEQWSTTVVKSRETKTDDHADDEFETTRIVYERLGR